MKKLLLTVLTTTLISLLVACGEQSKAAEDVIKTYTVTLSAASEVPAVAVASDATGTVTVTLNETKKEVSVSGSYSGLTGPAVAAHIHGSADRSGNGPVVLDLVVTADAKSAQLQTTAGHGGHDEDKDGANSGKLSLEATSLTDAQIADMKKGMHYINVHTAANAPGEIRGQIDENVVTAYVFALSAANEVPTVATASKGTGKVTVLLNETTKEQDLP